ncbi:hypothetical protein JCM3770_003960 [Rhodotorula araucariae]
MRDSNFNFPALGRACICVSSGIYDRRALDAPPASLPLINSLTHLTYLTATSPRVRDIISHDGGLERLVRILQHCARGGLAGAVPASLAELRGKGKGKARARLSRVPRRSPFKAFAEYDLLPTAQDLFELEAADVDGALFAKSAEAGGALGGGYSYTIPPSLLLPAASTSKHLLYTYSLAFQCIVNIGVRGSEAIRTRVVEAGALDVVIFVLERYLEDVERRRTQNQVEWRRGERERDVQMRDEEGGSEPPARATQHRTQVERRLERIITTSNASSPASSAPVSPVPSSNASVPSLPHIVVPPSAISRPLLTRLNVVAASSAAASAPIGSLQPPSRVHTPDTVVSSTDEVSSLTGDENGSASGREQDAEGDEVMAAAPSSSSSTAAMGESMPLAEVTKGTDATPAPPRQDNEGDVVMDDVAPAAAPQQPAPRPRQHRTRPPMARAHTSPPPLRRTPSGAVHAAPAPAPPVALATPPGAAEDDGALHFRDEDILLSLQLLAYLSKYPHVRSIFHAPSAELAASGAARMTSSSASCAALGRRAPLPPTNIFSLVEAFTYRPPADDPFTPRHATEVQYWAGVIMRNACRKDEAQGGIRQCANMRCGKWEAYAREFAKCRRCRRAKYCSKTCQSEAWNQGHRYWCHKVASRREPGSAAHAHGHGHSHAHDRTAALAAPASGPDSGASGSSAPASPTPGPIATPTGAVPPLGVAAAGAPAGDLFGLVPPVPTPGAPRRRAHAGGSHPRRQRRRGTGDDDDDELDELDDEDPLALGSGATPRASQGAQALHPHPHPHPHPHARHGAQTPPDEHAGVAVDRTPVPFGGLDGMGMFDLAGLVGDVGEGVVAIDEDQVAREMLALGADEGGAVRVPV